MTHSAIYPGTVLHARTRPVRHRLRYRMLNLLLDLDEVPALAARLRLLGHNRRALFEFRETDHGDGSATPLRDQVQAQLRAAGLDPAGGSIRVLCMPRLLGMAFNPLTVYFCDAADGTPQALLYEVNNTFGQRHSYLIPVQPGEQAVIRQRIAKKFYVSPFMDMALTYHFRVAPPGVAVSLAMEVHDAAGAMLFAAFAGRRQPLTDAGLLRAFVSHPLLALKVVAGIHWEALKLWRKGLTLRPRPAPPAHPVTLGTP